MANEIEELDKKIQGFLGAPEAPAQTEKFTGFEGFFKKAQRTLESNPQERKQRRAKKLKRAASKKRTRDLIARQRMDQSMQLRVTEKLAKSAVYGMGIPGEDIVPQAVHGMNLEPNIWGEPAQGLDPNKFLNSLDDDEREYVNKLMQQEQQAFASNVGG